MKRIGIVFIALFLVLALTACSGLTEEQKRILEEYSNQTSTKSAESTTTQTENRTTKTTIIRARLFDAKDDTLVYLWHYDTKFYHSYKNCPYALGDAEFVVIRTKKDAEGIDMLPCFYCWDWN